MDERVVFLVDCEKKGRDLLKANSLKRVRSLVDFLTTMREM